MDDADPEGLPLLVGHAAGTGVHGMAGYYAARTVLRREFGITTLPNLAP